MRNPSRRAPSGRAHLRLLLAAAAALPGAALPPQAEAQRTKDLVAALGSESPRDVAHAAHTARSVTARELTSALQKALHRWAEDDRDHADLVRLFLIDALLAHGARVPAEDLRPLLDDPRTEVPALALLARDSRQHEATLFEHLRAHHRPTASPAFELDLRWQLIADLLIDQRTPGFAAHLWSLREQTLHVIAHDGPFGDSNAFSIGLPERRSQPPEPGFPPLPRYQLMRESSLDGHDPARDGWTGELVVAGRSTVAIVRNHPHTSLAMAGLPAHDEWLARLAGVPAADARSQRHLQVRFTTPGAFATQVAAERDRAAAEAAALRDALVRSGALTEEQARRCGTTCEIVVADRRKAPGEALPEIPAAK